MNDDTRDNWTGAPLPESPTPAPGPRRPLLRRRAASVATLAGLTVGGIAGGYVIGHAATAGPSPSATASPSGGSTAPAPDGHACSGGMHGLQAEDATVVAGAIGISAADLQTALQNGQTIAAVAKAHNVDAGKVISALVASENKEIDDRVASGQITKAQADQMKQQTQQRVTDEVNGTFRGGPGGPGGFRAHGFGGPGAPGAPSSGSTQSSSPSA